LKAPAFQVFCGRQLTLDQQGDEMACRDDSYAFASLCDKTLDLPRRDVQADRDLGLPQTIAKQECDLELSSCEPGAGSRGRSGCHAVATRTAVSVGYQRRG
jgi:hypothetical protein